MTEAVCRGGAGVLQAGDTIGAMLRDRKEPDGWLVGNEEGHAMGDRTGQWWGLRALPPEHQPATEGFRETWDLI